MNYNEQKSEKKIHSICNLCLEIQSTVVWSKLYYMVVLEENM